jgi:hypothetical protein
LSHRLVVLFPGRPRSGNSGAEKLTWVMTVFSHRGSRLGRTVTFYLPVNGAQRTTHVT